MNKGNDLLNLSNIFYSNSFDYLYYTFILIILGFLWVIISNPKKSNLYLYIIHSTLGILFLFYSKNFQADSTRFYILSSPHMCKNILDTDFILNSVLTYCTTGITKLIINNYGFSTGIFSFIGFLGLNFFFNFLQKISININDRLNILYFFAIPSISFWTTGIGKDTLMIFFTGLIFKFIADDYLQEISIKNLTKKRKLTNFFYLTLGLLGAYLTRTYALYIFIVSLIFSRVKDFLKIIFNLKLKKSQLFLIPIMIFILIYVNNLLFDILNFKNAEVTTDSFNLIEQRALLSQFSAIESGGSFVSQTGIQKLIYIIGGPFSFISINFILETIVGLIFTAIFYSIFRNINILNKLLIRSNRLILFSISLATMEIIKIYIFAFNWGIIVRQRIVPFILFFIIYYILRFSKYKREYFQ
tara:strand:- start:6310 stop:7554 length:1245 start_codon:yes stop_codon:yes gene_type:complete